MKDRMEKKGNWPCDVRKKGVGNNSIFCHGCKKWIHKRCSGVKGSLRNASQSFICRCCKVDRPITDGLNADLHLPILTGKGFSLKLKGKEYATCVWSCLMHGSETWSMKVEHELKMNRTEYHQMDVWG